MNVAGFLTRLARVLHRGALILAVGALAVIALLQYTGTGVNVTESEPPGLYVRIPGLPQRGGMVALRPLMKHVAATPGDVVTVTPKGSYVNGRLWPHSGIPVTASSYRPFPFGVYTLRPEQYWLLGTSPDSWDSRYLGPIPIELIATNVRPVWTVSNGYAPATRP